MRGLLGFVRRPDVWLPVAGVVVASALIVLGAAAARALQDRHALALEGRTLRLAQRVERELRETGPASAEGVLGSRLASEPGLATGLALLGLDGELQTEVGELAAEGLRDVELHLGRTWHQGARPRGARPRDARPRGAGRRGGQQGGGMPGQRTLRIAIAPEAQGQASSERLLLPATVFAGLALAALSALGGRLLRRQQRAQQSAATRRRLEGIARAGAGLAHQLRTPLATIKGSCQLLLESDASRTGETEAKRLRSAVSQTERMETMLRQLLDYARPPKPEPSAVDLEAVARELVLLDTGRVNSRVACGRLAWVDPEHLREILSNLVDNALRASLAARQGDRSDAVEVTAEARGRWVEVRVADRGPGPGDEPEGLFEPYVTRRADGTGLGLPIARSLAEANGGRLDLVARTGGGTIARLRLPRPEPGR